MSDTVQILKKELQEDYPLIPTKDITDEARMIAVAWMECDDKNWIGNKQKLASDIMNYARRSSQHKIKSFRKKLENITIDELLSNPKIVLELFDKEFGLTLP